MAIRYLVSYPNDIFEIPDRDVILRNLRQVILDWHNGNVQVIFIPHSYHLTMIDDDTGKVSFLTGAPPEIYADWLEEQGRTEEAKKFRSMIVETK